MRCSLPSTILKIKRYILKQAIYVIHIVNHSLLFRLRLNVKLKIKNMNSSTLAIFTGLQQLIYSHDSQEISSETWKLMLDEILKDRDKNFKLFERV